MKHQMFGAVILHGIRAVLAAVVLFFMITPHIAFVGSTEKADVFAYLIEVYSEEDFDHTIGFLSQDTDREMMNVRTFADRVFDLQEDCGWLAPVVGVLLKVVFWYACFEFVMALVGFFGILLSRNEEFKKAFDYFNKPNLFAIGMLYLILIVIQMTLLQPYNDALFKMFRITLRVVIMDCIHPVWMLIGILVVFYVAKAIVASVCNEPEKTSE